MTVKDQRPQDVREALSFILFTLMQNGVDSSRAQAESEQLVRAAYFHATKRELQRIDLYVKESPAFPESASLVLIGFAQQRVNRVPLQYVIGNQAFLSHEYDVGPGVLIPRPETEVLVTSMIKDLAQRSDSPRLGFEMGVGSGIISIELLAHFPLLKMIGSELSATAAQHARKNAQKILGSKNESRLTILEVQNPLDVFEPFQSSISGEKADFLVSNPPYLKKSDCIDHEVFKFEPHEALFAPENDPLYFYRRIAEDAGEFVRPNGSLFLEIPHERASEIKKLFCNGLWCAQIQEDLTQRSRVLIAQFKA